MHGNNFRRRQHRCVGHLPSVRPRMQGSKRSEAKMFLPCFLADCLRAKVKDAILSVRACCVELEAICWLVTDVDRSTGIVVSRAQVLVGGANRLDKRGRPRGG